MKSYQVVDFGKPLELREYENPKPEGKEILVKISACGVCHSDLHLADGYFDLGDGKRITNPIKLSFRFWHLGRAKRNAT